MSENIADVPAIGRLDESSWARWEQFVLDCPDATFFHRAGWKRVIEKSFGHACDYLYAESNGRIRGVLPLVHVKSRLFGNSLISNAFCVYGGPAATDEHAEAVLSKAAMEVAQLRKVKYLEYRLRWPSRRDWPRVSDLYATFRKDLVPEPEVNLAGVPRKQRAMIRKGTRAGLRSKYDDRIDRFYRLYAESVRNLGTPVFPREFFSNLKSEFGDDCHILIVTKDHVPVSGVMSFHFRDEVLPYYGGGTAQARAFASYDFMYWEVMRDACERGYRTFDFGRSKYGTGSFSFKKNWGFEPQPLHYEYSLLQCEDIPQVNPLNPKYRLAISVWRRLPLPIANLLGPWLSRSLG